MENSLLFGVGGLLLIYFIHPFLSFFFFSIPKTIRLILSSVFFILFLIDIFITLTTMWNLHIAQKKFKKKDATEEITKMIRLELVNHKALVIRLLRAFPNLSIENNKSTLYKIKVYLEKRDKKKKQKKDASLFSMNKKR